MRKFLCFPILWIGIAFFSCTSKESKEKSAQDWKEMEAIQTLVEKAFRPLKDSSSVVMAEQIMDEIAKAAERLSSAPLPDKMNNEEMKKKLEKLKTDTRALANEIATGTEDDVIGTDFYNIHDLFMEIHDAWVK